MLKKWKGFYNEVQPYFRKAIKIYNKMPRKDKLKYTPESGVLRVQSAGAKGGMDVVGEGGQTHGDAIEDYLNVIFFLAALCWAAWQRLPIRQILQIYEDLD